MKTKTFGFFVFIFILFFFTPCNSLAQSAKMEEMFMAATGMVHADSKKSKHIGMCTTVAFARNENKYLFFTNAHCVAQHNKKTGKTTSKNADLHILLEDKNGDVYSYEAVIWKTEEKGLAIGQMGDFEDLAILEAEIDKDIPIMPLAESDLVIGEDVRIVTAPFGPNMGFLSLKGYVSKAKFSKSTATGNAKIVEASIIQIIGLGSGEGSSGSGVFSIKRNALAGIIVGSAANGRGHQSFLVIPITKFNNFYKKYTEK